MWSVVLFAPNVRKTLFKSEQRGEAEAYSQKFARLVGNVFTLEVIWEEVLGKAA